MADSQQTIQIQLGLPAWLIEKLSGATARTGCDTGEIVEQALRSFLAGRRGGNAVYLSAPINALVEGFSVENTTVGQIKEHGDFGLGTFNYLDGEMVLLDGKAYQIRSDGKAHGVEDGEQSPFACVTFFSPDTFDDIAGAHKYVDFHDLLDHLIPSRNMLYAIRIDGVFSHVRTRVVPKSENYVPLAEVARNQPVFDLYNTQGSLAGFYTPRFMESLSAPGYHLHFLTADRQQGGHVMECAIEKARIGIQHVPQLELGLPITFDFLTADLTRDVSKDLEDAEK
jgi:acetolactate decarboxylase